VAVCTASETLGQALASSVRPDGQAHTVPARRLDENSLMDHRCEAGQRGTAFAGFERVFYRAVPPRLLGGELCCKWWLRVSSVHGLARWDGARSPVFDQAAPDVQKKKRGGGGGGLFCLDDVSLLGCCARA